MKNGFVFSSEALLAFAVIVIALGLVLSNFPKSSSQSFQFETAALKSNDNAIVSFYLSDWSSAQTSIPIAENYYCSQSFSYKIAGGIAESKMFCSGGFS